MLGQTFDLSDIPKLLSLIFIEIFLSVDNALVLAVLVNSLPLALRKKALFIGTTSAFFLRAMAVLAVSIILKFVWLELIGAAYLLYLSISHFYRKASITTPQPTSFWKTVCLIEFFDIAFALDSIIAGVAFIAGPTTTFVHPKIWIVYVGGMIGLFCIRFGASQFSRLLDTFPRLVHTAYLLIALVAIKLALDVLFPHLPYLIPTFWFLFILLFLFGLKKN